MISREIISIVINKDNIWCSYVDEYGLDCLVYDTNTFTYFMGDNSSFKTVYDRKVSRSWLL